MMSLPTPPHTGHREKENRVPLKSHVIWSPNNEYHTIKPVPQVPAATSASKDAPKKSILKKRSEPILPFVEFQREETPEPSRPQFDATYLSTPVKTIIDASASLDDLIRAYSVLAARIRANITLSNESNTSYPLLQPLRRNKVALEQAIVRDLGRCLVDPETMVDAQSSEDKEEEACLKGQDQPERVFLPSPQKSPKKKKKGTTARKAKYGRDLCTICHSVLKLLGVVFTLPAVYGVFSFPQLRSILTEVLAIPLADDLPTANGRKTYALAIWLLQTQRLPLPVLEGAADRIMFALRRGIEGELGKEGKKGAASDGLKAIHDLSVYLPSVFIPRFENLVPQILGNLLAPTTGIRTQACHALGGFARGLATLPVSSLHARVSATTVRIITTVSSPTKKSPTKFTESALVRTIRTTLTAAEAQSVSQGPVWGLSVTAALMVMCNSNVYANKDARQVFIAMLSCAMQHKKSSIRSLGSAVWRVAAWAYCQPLLPASADDESEVDDVTNSSPSFTESQQGREKFWKGVVATVFEMGVGVSTIAALLEDSNSDVEETLTRVATMVKLMASRGGNAYKRAVETLARMVSFEPPESPWNWNKLLPRGLFSASPGVLTADFNGLETPVRSIVGQCPDEYDVRSLTQDDVAQPAVFTQLIEMWIECVGYMGLQDNDPIPPKILSIWESLIQAKVAVLQDGDEADSDIADLAVEATGILIDVLTDSNIDVTLKAGHVPFCTDGQAILSNGTLKLKVVRALWAGLRKIVPHAQLGSAGEKMICELIKLEDEVTDSADVSRTEWAMFCAEVLVVCDPDDLKDFWNYSKWDWTNDIRGAVWRCFVEGWKEEKNCVWEAIVNMLVMPFTAKKTWELCDSDCELWDSFLGYGIDKGLDYGLDAVSVLDHVASRIVQEHNPASTTAPRVTESLLEYLEKEEIRELPESLLELVNDTLRSSYPPAPRNKQRALWALRSLQRVIENCPDELAVDMLGLIEEGLITWLSDEHQALTEAEYEYDAVTLYQVVLLKMRSLPLDEAIPLTLASILASGFVGRDQAPAGITAAFEEFWSDTYSQYPVPEGGWSAEILTCLGIPEDTDSNVDEPWGKLALSAPFRGEEEVLPNGIVIPAGSPFKLSPARFRSVSVEPATKSDNAVPQAVALVAPPCRPVTPTTPVTVRLRATTPPRPHKLPSMVQNSPTSPASPFSAQYPPATPSTPHRSPLQPLSPSKGSLNKRRKLDNKENESPPHIASVMERIAASPKSGHDLSVGKKTIVAKRWREERPAKRSKTERSGPQQSFSPGSSDSDEEEEERLVEYSLVAQTQSTSRLSDADAIATPSPFSKKRKRVVFDGVEVPSARHVYSQVGQSPPESRSTSKAARALSMYDSPSISRKRPRDTDDDPFSDDSNAGRSHQSSSSDDDTFFGQVTPHHVCSPALRLRAQDDDPPSSDDSSVSSSPLKAVVSRRLQRTASNARVQILSQ
ncbi:hypothetical protein R3P38DRAFT_2869948 [Favolaschia claudopus]|uniref:Telomere-associated protein Rif1 N-terminal domain-containing protein n=1 Tax=Favolaschia claudopus TaxID=2862362 RepID=A0AAW0DAN1_9AGAR